MREEILGSSPAPAPLSDPSRPKYSIDLLSESGAAKLDISTRGEPFLVEGVPTREGWKAAEKWKSVAALKQHYGEVEFKIGHYASQAGGSVEDLKLGEFLDRLVDSEKERLGGKSAREQRYLVEKNWVSEAQQAVLGDYKVPKVFSDDLLTEVPSSSGKWRSKFWWIGGSG